MPRSIDELLEEARARLDRVDARRAFDEPSDGAPLIDTRPLELRRATDVIDGVDGWKAAGLPLEPWTDREEP